MVTSTAKDIHNVTILVPLDAAAADHQSWGRGTAGAAKSTGLSALRELESYAPQSAFDLARLAPSSLGAEPSATA